MDDSFDPPSRLPSHTEAVRIGYVGSAFPLAFVDPVGKVKGIYAELWRTALRGKERIWEQRVVTGSYDPDEYGYFDGMLGEMQNGTLHVALQDYSYRQSRMDVLYYSLPVEEWEENFYESRKVFFDPAIIVVPFTAAFTAILVTLVIAMSLTEAAVRAVITRWGGRNGSFRVSYRSLTLLDALFHRLAIIFVLIIYNAAFVGLATSPGVEPVRTLATVMPLFAQGRITLVVNYENAVKTSALEEMFGDDPADDANRYRVIAEMGEKQNVLCRNKNAIFFGRLHSITHNDPDTRYKQQCAFKSIESTDLSFLPADSELLKMHIGHKYMSTFYMSRTVPRSIREQLSFVQLALFDRDMKCHSSTDILYPHALFLGSGSTFSYLHDHSLHY